LLPGILPPVSHLPGHAQTARHLGGGMPLGEQFACLKAAFFGSSGEFESGEVFGQAPWA
jgi:hypothetical protein